MWSRLQPASGIQLTDLLIMPQVDEDFCFAEIRTKHPKNYSAIITLSYSQEKWGLCFAGSFYIFENATDRFMFPNSIKSL